MLYETRAFVVTVSDRSVLLGRSGRRPCVGPLARQNQSRIKVEDTECKSHSFPRSIPKT